MNWNVVIIDDDYQVVAGMEATLKQSGLPCTVVGTANNGKAGLDLVQTTLPDVIITDIYMPMMDGIDMIRQLRQQGFNQKIIILSGYSEFQHAQQALKLNIVDYLSKPASRSTILTTIADVLNQLTAEQEKKRSNQQFRLKLKQYEKYFAEGLIELAIKGHIDHASLQTNQRRFINRWPEQFHLPVKLNFKHLKDAVSAPHNYELLSFAIANIVKDTIAEHELDHYYIEVDQINHLLCFYKKDCAGKALNVLAGKALRAIKENLLSLLKVDLQFECAHYSTEWHDFIADVHQLLAMKLPFASDTLTIELPNIKKQLSRAIQSTNIQLIQTTIDDFFKTVSTFTFAPAITVQIGIEIFTIFKYELHENGIYTLDDLFQSTDLYQTFVHFRSWRELDFFFQGLIDQLAQEPIFQDDTRHSKLINQVIAYIDNNLNRNLTLNEIAEELFISRNYLGKLFKTKMAISFKEYVTKAKIEAARKMLVTGDYMIYEAAEAVGFDNPAYFTSVFKKVAGYPPSQIIHEDNN
ncbi:two component transcriptional regulator, AraC family [Amphibacillus marinus]|uniref:Two component transcriptional regulator, AraC family n=1 Tax=Amphibacillus marinus TaxID=872970 RepID=A0A1H8H705_9BACI|nr:response regulator [Amphibacillus marinus]SEN51790.1 two component transcriptional regulator, AraC family [Amphibacillus marinus]